MKRWLLGTVTAAAIVAACVGDDATPANGTTTPDGGTNTTAEAGSTSGSTPDGGSTVLGSCFGKPFGTPASVTATLADAGAATKIEAVRVVDTSAYFARTDTGDAPTYLFKADYAAAVGVTPPTLSNATSVLAPHVGESDLAPAVASDASFIVFTHDEIGNRILWAATAGNPGFANAGSANISSGLTDDADPWLAGAPSTRLYFGRGQKDGTAMRIVYTDVTPVVGDVPTFGSVVSFAPPCPVGSTDNCGKPVVTPDQSMLLFASWSAGLTSANYAMHEVALTKDGTGKVTAGTDIVDHAELGARAVSWVSVDGCQVLLDDGLGNAGIFYARRSPD